MYSGILGIIRFWIFFTFSFSIFPLTVWQLEREGYCFLLLEVWSPGSPLSLCWHEVGQCLLTHWQVVKVLALYLSSSDIIPLESWRGTLLLQNSGRSQSLLIEAHNFSPWCTAEVKQLSEVFFLSYLSFYLSRESSLYWEFFLSMHIGLHRSGCLSCWFYPVLNLDVLGKNKKEETGCSFLDSEITRKSLSFVHSTVQSLPMFAL